MKCPMWLYKRIDRRGRLPRWVRLIWRSAHWCPEMDELLVIDNIGDCLCGHVPRKTLHCVRCGRLFDPIVMYLDSTHCEACFKTETTGWDDEVIK